MKGRKRLFRVLLGVGLLALYLLRIQAVNRENDKTRIHYLEDDMPVRTQNLEITVGEQILYETSACAARYPAVQEYYESLAELYRPQNNLDVLAQDRYILCVRLRVKNCSDELQQIDYTNFHINVGVSYHNGIDPALFGAVNQFSGLSLRPGHSYEFWMPYSLNETGFQPEKYRDLMGQDFSMLLAGYPDIRHVRLGHLRLEEAAPEEASAFAQLFAAQETSGEALPAEDTPEGTLLEKGEAYVQSGIRFTAVSCRVTRDVAEETMKYHWESCDEDATWKDIWKGEIVRGFMDEEGRFFAKTQYGRDYQAVFVTVRLQNLSGQDQTIPLQPALNNYAGKGSLGANATSLGPDIEHEQYSAYYTVKEGADTTVTFLYYTNEVRRKCSQKKRWYIHRKALYLDFAIGANDDADIPEGYYSRGKFLQVQ